MTVVYTSWFYLKVKFLSANRINVNLGKFLADDYAILLCTKPRSLVPLYFFVIRFHIKPIISPDGK